MRIIIILTSITFLLLSGCGNDQTDHSDHSHDSSSSDTHAHQKQVNSDKQEIRLDDGSKWKLDDHTRSKFGDMSHHLGSSLSGKELGVQLQEDLDKLITGCTMTGEAHNQLHIFLTEFIPAVKGLKETGDSASASQVKSLLEKYPNYFE